MSDSSVEVALTANATDTSPAPSPVDASSSSESASPQVRDTTDLAREAFAAAQGAADSLSAAPAVPSPPAQAAIAPGESSATPVVSTPPGPIPFDRHKAALTARDNKLAAVQAQYKWVDELGLPQQDVTQGAQLARFLRSDPEGFLKFVQSKIQPPTGGQMSGPGDDMPQPDLPLEDGRALYSHEQQVKLLEWQRKQTLAEVEKTYGPMRQRHEVETIRAANEREAGSWLAQARAEWPMFAELESEVAAVIARSPAEQDVTPSTFRDAYIRVLRDVGLKRQQEQWEAARAAQLQKKASAGSMQPGIPRPTSPKPNSQKSIEELTREAFANAR